MDTHYLDSYVLHGPYSMDGLALADWEVWGAMEELNHEGKACLLGVSNVDVAQLRALHERSRVKPAFVHRPDNGFRFFLAGNTRGGRLNYLHVS